MNIPHLIRSSGGCFFIQWHITERCNWHCKHCYQEGPPAELPFSALNNILSQCLDVFKILRVPPESSRINITGGEPFIRKDFFDFLSLVNEYKSRLHLGIMTNGSLITRSVAKRLSCLAVLKSIQISLEGMEPGNDAIRGKSAFQQAISAIRLLREYGITVRISVTVTRHTLQEAESLIAYLKKMGVASIGFRRYVPLGRGRQLKKHMLSPLETRDFYLKRRNLMRMFNEPRRFRLSWGCEDSIFFAEHRGGVGAKSSSCMRRACAVLDGRGFTIMSNGDVYPCRRFPLVIGNALKTDLFDIYFSSDDLWSYKDPQNANPLCKTCPAFSVCLGGAKCMSYAYFKNPFAPDPQCWRLFKKLPDPERFPDK